MLSRLQFILLLLLLGMSLAPMSARACPNPDAAAGSLLRETGVGLRWGTSVRVLAAGDQPLTDCPQVGVARQTSATFTTAPTLQLELAGMIGLGIELRAVRGCAREFLIQTADGTWYHRGPGMTGMVPPVVISKVGNGPLRLWVGTAPEDRCRMRIEVSTVTN